jgi:hypothetical protein
MTWGKRNPQSSCRGHRYHGWQCAVAEAMGTRAQTHRGQPERLLLLVFRREKFLFNGGHNDVVGVDHFGEMEFADLGEQLISVELG